MLYLRNGKIFMLFLIFLLFFSVHSVIAEDKAKETGTENKKPSAFKKASNSVDSAKKSLDQIVQDLKQMNDPKDKEDIISRFDRLQQGLKVITASLSETSELFRQINRFRSDLEDDKEQAERKAKNYKDSDSMKEFFLTEKEENEKLLKRVDGVMNALRSKRKYFEKYSLELVEKEEIYLTQIRRRKKVEMVIQLELLNDQLGGVLKDISNLIAIESSIEIKKPGS